MIKSLRSTSTSGSQAKVDEVRTVKAVLTFSYLKKELKPANIDKTQVFCYNIIAYLNNSQTMQQIVEKQPDIHELQITRLHEAMVQAEHVTVEFGTGDMPLFESQDAQAFNAQNLYIGVNIDSKQHKYLADRVESIDGFAVLGKKSEDGNIDSLPIPEKSVDTVFMANVFGEPDSEYIMEPFKHADGLYRGNSNIESKTATLEEAKRLLKDGGRIVVLENNTPYGAGFSGNYDSMVKILEGAGFHVAVAINQKSVDWGELVTPFAKPVEWWSYGSYIVIAQKPDSNKV